MKSVFFIRGISLLLFLMPLLLKAQEEEELFFDIIEDDLVTVEALSLYPSETRKAILTASLYPEVLVRLEHMQSQTRARFLEIIEGRPEEEQQKIYELTRYNGLIEKLSEGQGRKTEEEINRILKDYPQEIHSTAMELGRKQHGLLKQISSLNASAEKSFDKILSNYDTEAQNAYRHLIMLPEVIDLLSENMRLTVTMGDLYKREPEMITSRLDSISLEAARRNAEETAEWKRTLEENPEMLEEFRHSAEAYANEKGYSEEEYRSERVIATEVAYHHYYAYPFWFGYPHWYPYAYWYRWPVWYDWGFFYGPGGAMVLTGMPSFYFTYWYFHHPRHHIYYPRLSTTFVNHYQNHPRSVTGVSAGVSTWVRDNREILPSNFLSDDGNRTQRMREFGQFETEFRERVERRPGRAVSREEFLSNNARRFPNLAEPGLRAGEIEDIRRGRFPEGEAAQPRQRIMDGERVDPRLHDPASPEPRTGERRGIRDRPIERTTPPERQRPGERAVPSPGGRRAPAERGAPPVERRSPPRGTPPASPPRSPDVTPRSPSPAPGRTQPSPQPGTRPGSPRGTSIIYERPTDNQRLDMGREYHHRVWNSRRR